MDPKAFDDLYRKIMRRTTDGVPGWWRGDDDAAASSMAVARMLGLKVPAMGT